MIFDTDILIFVQHQNRKAAELIFNANERFISVQTYMELLQGAKNKAQHQIISSFLKDFNFYILPLTENIGHRAGIYSVREIPRLSVLTVTFNPFSR